MAEMTEAERMNATLDRLTMLKAFQGARRLAKRKRDPNWVFAMELFGLGSTYAWGMCKRMGVDPDSTSANLPMPGSPDPTRSELPDEIGAAIESLIGEAKYEGGRFSSSDGADIDCCRATLTVAILARLTAAEAEREEAEAYGREVGAALVGLTCDGSEFYGRGGKEWRVDPAACAAYIRRQRSDKHDSILRFAKRANAAEAERDAALARVERMEKALTSSIRAFEEIQLNSDLPTARRASDARERARAALAPVPSEDGIARPSCGSL